ncbi:MAG TPA: isoprenylcysteine carboxylmethyltransferase family protein [Planctomycetota bacterium]|nr:isoprenylcysteine carboxylmethyltransferase family protein [Planctomycetota bacterium]
MSVLPEGFPAAYAALLGLVALQRIGELLLSRRHVASAGPSARTAESPAHFRWIAAVHVGLLVLPAVEVGIRGRGAPDSVFFAALAVFLAAQALRYSAIRSLGRSWNVRAVVDPALGVVAGGPYRWIRHPNYLAIVLEFLSIPAAGGAWISLLVLNALSAPLLARRIREEEAALARVPGYLEAMGSKGRLVPRLRRPASPALR